MREKSVTAASFAQFAPIREITIRSRRGTYSVKRRARGSVKRGAVPRALVIRNDRGQLRDYAARVAELGAPPTVVLVALLLCLHGDESGKVDPRWSTQEQLARFGVSVASIRRAEDWLARRGLLLRERVQLGPRKRLRILRCVLRASGTGRRRSERIPTAHGERLPTAQGERLGEHPRVNPQTPDTTPREIAGFRVAPPGAPPPPCPSPPDSSPAGSPVGKDERPCGAMVGGVASPLAGSSRAGDAIPRAPRSEIRAALGTEEPEGANPITQFLAARGRPRRSTRTPIPLGSSPSVDREAFESIERAAGVVR